MNVNILFNKCRRYQADLSLLATDALENERCAQTRDHLESCPACQVKFAELQSLAIALGQEGKALPNIEPSAALRRRWTSAIRESAEKKSQAALRTQYLFGRKLAWSGIAAIWVLILFFRFNAPDVPKTNLAATAPSSLRAVLLALKVEASETQPARGRSTPEPVSPEELPPRSQTQQLFHNT